MAPENHASIDFKFNIRMYFSFISKYRGLFLFVVGVAFLVEILAIVPSFIFKYLIDGATSFISGGISKPEFFNVLVILGALSAADIVLRSVLRWVHVHFINRLSGNLMRDVKRKFFNHVIGLSYRFHTSNKTGALISRIIRGAGAVEGMTDMIIFNVLPTVFGLLSISTIIFYFNKITAGVLLFFSALFIGFTLFMQNKQKKANMLSNNASDFEKANISDFLTNIASIKYFGKQKAVRSRFKEITKKTLKAGLYHWDYFRWSSSGQMIIIGLAGTLLLFIPAFELWNGRMGIGTLTLIYTATGRVTGQLYSFVWAIRGFYRSMADFESLFQYSKEKNEIQDKKEAKEYRIMDGRLHFKNVWFKYYDKWVFKDFDISVSKGKKIAIVGHSGSGKSTLIKLLYRLYDVDKGAILIDDHDIRDFKKESLRAQMSIVPQEAILFDDTIYNNIAFSKPQAKRKDVLKAMSLAQLEKIVRTFPKKEKTIVGERGVKLSGGEKQRVSIARAILANKKILVLDEATSSLDSETENEIQKALEVLLQGKTSIIIAHRLSTIMKADMIVVMDKGRIVQTGTHTNLISQDGLYKSLWNLQKGGYIGTSRNGYINK